MLFEGAAHANPYVFKGTNHDGKSCTLEFNTPSDSEFVVILHQSDGPGTPENLVAKITINKAATLSRATRSFDSYFSEHYKLFIPSGGFDILEHRKRHDNSEYQLFISSSIDQNKWFDCGKFNLMSQGRLKPVELPWQQEMSNTSSGYTDHEAAGKVHYYLKKDLEDWKGLCEVMHGKFRHEYSKIECHEFYTEWWECTGTATAYCE